MKWNGFLFSLCLLVSNYSNAQAPASYNASEIYQHIKKLSVLGSVLYVAAHPDDENMIGPVLAKFGRLGYEVQVIIATDGRDGTRVTKIPAGDSLGKLRQQESICACTALQINAPIFLHLERLDTKIGVRAYLNAHQQLLVLLRKYIDHLNPDIIISFGPDGEYGHPEHIVVGSTVIDVLLREGWVERYPLYFPIVKKSRKEDPEISYADDRYINLEIAFSQTDKDKYFAAAKCYVTQFTQEEMKEIVESESNENNNLIHFRKFIVAKGVQKDLFK